MLPPSGRKPSSARSLFSFLFSAAFLLAAVSAASAQSGGVDFTGTNGKHRIKGYLYFPSGRSVDTRLKVKLESLNSGTLTVMTDSNGSFSFMGLAPGSYTIVIESEDYETARESVYIDTDARSRRGVNTISAPRVYTVMVYLQLKRAKTTEKAGVINAALANVPQQARDLYRQALEASQGGNHQRAVELLKGAVSLYPEFALAFNELGTQYLRLGRPGEAAEALRSALKYSPDNFNVLLNYGIALLNKKEFAEAETQLRLALRQKEYSPLAHMYLGIALINLRKYEEAESSLSRAITAGGEGLSLVHYYLGGIYWRKREYKRAAEQLEKYLQLSPKAPDAEKIRATIKDLRSKPA